MKRLNFLIICAVLLFVFESCESFIPDPVDPRLSKYTEKGLNVSSALINDSVWIAEPAFYFKHGVDPNHYLIYQPDNDTISIQINGNSGTIEFVFIGYGIDDLQKLNKLREKKILVGNQNFYATFNDVKAENGQIYFKHVESTDSMAILSGTFGFTIPDPAIKVSYGRFDFKVRKGDNFRIK